MRNDAWRGEHLTVLDKERARLARMVEVVTQSDTRRATFLPDVGDDSNHVCAADADGQLVERVVAEAAVAFARAD